MEEKQGSRRDRRWFDDNSPSNYMYTTASIRFTLIPTLNRNSLFSEIYLIMHIFKKYT